MRERTGPPSGVGFEGVVEGASVEGLCARRGFSDSGGMMGNAWAREEVGEGAMRERWRRSVGMTLSANVGRLVVVEGTGNGLEEEAG